VEARSYRPIERYKTETLVEIENLAALHGNKIVNQVLGAEIYENMAMIVLEYVEGMTLWDWLLKTPPPTQTQRLTRFNEIEEALDVLHRAGFVHLDINSKNIWIPKQEHRPAFFLDLAAMTPIGKPRVVHTRTEEYYPSQFSNNVNFRIGDPKINAYSMKVIYKNIFEDRIAKKKEASRAFGVLKKSRKNMSLKRRRTRNKRN
jgi:serine/threonine protein kinase